MFDFLDLRYAKVVFDLFGKVLRTIDIVPIELTCFGKGIPVVFGWSMSAHYKE